MSMTSNLSSKKISAICNVLRGKSDQFTSVELEPQTIQCLKQLRERGSLKWCVLYLKNGTEHRSAWFRSLAKCQKAFEIISVKHGYQAIIFID